MSSYVLMKDPEKHLKDKLYVCLNSFKSFGQHTIHKGDLFGFFKTNIETSVKYCYFFSRKDMSNTLYANGKSYILETYNVMSMYGYDIQKNCVDINTLRYCDLVNYFNMRIKNDSVKK